LRAEEPIGNGVEKILTFDTSVYRLNAVKKAAYRFGDRCYVQVEVLPTGQTRVTLKPKRRLENTEQLAGEFQNEVLDQELREVVAAETETVRNLILAHAFSETSLLDPTGEDADYRQDPLGIRSADASI
jgi:His-Xaa-Ser system protein HxsD